MCTCHDPYLKPNLPACCSQSSRVLHLLDPHKEKSPNWNNLGKVRHTFRDVGRRGEGDTLEPASPFRETFMHTQNISGCTHRTGVHPETHCFTQEPGRASKSKPWPRPIRDTVVLLSSFDMGVTHWLLCPGLDLVFICSFSVSAFMRICALTL